MTHDLRARIKASLRSRKTTWTGVAEAALVAALASELPLSCREFWLVVALAVVRALSGCLQRDADVSDETTFKTPLETERE